MSVVLAKEVMVRTATVEIKALTISGKQMTLAIFRQLQRQSALYLDEYNSTGDWEFWGKVWGWVNYHSGCDWSEWGEHVHLVWEAENFKCEKLLLQSVITSNKLSPHMLPDHVQACEEAYSLVIRDYPQLFIAV